MNPAFINSFHTCVKPFPKTSYTFKCNTGITSASKTSPVFRPAPSPAWDSGAVSAPTIHRYATETGFSYAMWYSARPADWPGAVNCPPKTLGGFVGLALSEDGLQWNRVDEPVLSPNKEEWWSFDTTHVNLGKVLVGSNEKVQAESGIYMMYYSGGDMRVGEVNLRQGSQEVPGVRMRIGVAISKDGEYFSRLEGDYASGAILEGEGFDELFVNSPDVVIIRKRGKVRYVMHYYTYSNETMRFAVGRAVSKDGIKFMKDSDGPILKDEAEQLGGFAERGISRVKVVQRGNSFVMFAEVADGDFNHRIAICESNDCETWGPLKVVLEPSEDESAWDAVNVSHPEAVVMEDGSLRLYYVGRSLEHDVEAGKGTCIGVAQSVGKDWTTFERISPSIE